jgi:hypothetical protein
MPIDVTFNNVNVDTSLRVGRNSKKILNIQKDVVKSAGDASRKYELLTYKFPPNTFLSNNVIIFTSVVTSVDVEVDQHFIVAKNHGYNEVYNEVYIQVRDILGNLTMPYEINVLAIEYS